MGKNQSASGLTNIVQYDTAGNISLVSGSTTLLYISSSGAITTTGVISGSNALSASYAVSASNALAAQTASFVQNAQSASYVLTAQTASFVANAQSASNAVAAQTASFANAFTVAGTLTAQTLVVQTITSSVDFVTGSTRFGSLLDNTHVFSGSVTMNPGGLFVSSSGRVGIGTTSPNEVFEVFSPEVAGTSQQTRIRITQAASISSRVNLVSGVISGSNPYFAIEARQSASPFDIVERLRIDGSGNVGISTTSPLGSATERTIHLSDGGVGYTTLYVTNGANTLRGIFAVANGASTISIGTQTNTDLRIVTNDTPRITITNSGSVGIGINNPSRMLQVKSNSEGQTAGISGATYGIRFDNGGTNSPNMSTIHGTDSALVGSYQPIMLNGLDVRFGTSDTERMRISSAGNIGVNETSPSSMLHFSKQTTWGTTTNRIININNSGTGGDINVAHNMGSITWYSGNSIPTAEIAAYRNTPASGNNIELRFYTATAGTVIESMRISSSGTVTKQYQPAFRAGRSTSYTPGAGTIIAFNSTSGFGFNVGGHYSASTGRFTAPVTGIYNFTACIIWESVPDGQQMDDAFEIRVNGSTAAYSFNRAEYVAGTTGNGGYYVDNATVLLNLTAGQYVEVYNRFNLTIHGNQNYCYFTGYLVG